MSFFSELKRRNVIRMAALYAVGSWLILQVTELLVDILDVPDWTMRFILLLLVLGLPLALVFSWVYEMTPEGLKKEREVESHASVTAETARKLDVVVIFLLVAVLVTFAVDRLLPEGASNPTTSTATPRDDATTELSDLASDKTSDTRDGADDFASPISQVPANSVVVLPFDDRSLAGDSEYFSDGLTETLLHMLAGLPDLKVAARKSSFAFKGSDATPAEIGQQLGVANILEGSVQRSGDQVRVNAVLVRAEDGFTVWSKRFDKQLDSIFEIQDEIAEEVARALSVSLLSAQGSVKLAGVSTRNVQAYDLYLQALSEYQKASFGSLASAEDLLQAAIDLDPGFDEAYSSLAAVYLWQTNTGMQDFEVGMEKARVAAVRALTLDPDNVEAIGIEMEASARLALARGDFEAGNDDSKARAFVESTPGEVAPKRMYAGYLRYVGRLDEAIVLLDRALELDPLNAQLHYEKGIVFNQLGRSTEARIAFRESLRLEPEQPNIYTALGDMDFVSGDLVGFVQNVEIAMELDPADPEQPLFIAQTLCFGGLVDQAAPYLERSAQIAVDNDYADSVRLSCLAASGDNEGAIELAMRLLEADIGNRQGAFGVAVGELLLAHARRNTLAQGAAYLESLYPGFLDNALDAELDVKVAFSRLMVSPILAPLRTIEERRADATAIERYYAQTSRDLVRLRLPNIFYLALNGNEQDLVTFMLDDVFPNIEMVLPYSTMRQFFELPQYAKLASDPAIAAGLARWDSAFDRSRSRFLKFLEERDS